MKQTICKVIEEITVVEIHHSVSQTSNELRLKGKSYALIVYKFNDVKFNTHFIPFNFNIPVLRIHPSKL